PRGHQGGRRVRLASHLRAAPPPLGGEQRLPRDAAEPRARPLGTVTGQAPRRDDRAPRPPLLRRLPVPPRVQVAPDGATPAVPALHPRDPRGADPEPALRSPAGAPHHAALLTSTEISARSLQNSSHGLTRPFTFPGIAPILRVARTLRGHARQFSCQ